MKTYSVQFSHSGTEVHVPHGALRAALVNFLERWGTRFYLGPDFGTLLGHGDRFANLLRACGRDEAAFFEEVLQQLARTNHLTHHQMDDQEGPEVCVSGIVLPKRMLLVFLEQMLPGDGFVAVRSVEQYAELTNIVVPEEQREDLQQVIDTYPVRLSRHVLRQSRLSRHVAYQGTLDSRFMAQIGDESLFFGSLSQDAPRARDFDPQELGRVQQLICRDQRIRQSIVPTGIKALQRVHRTQVEVDVSANREMPAILEYIQANPEISDVVLAAEDRILNHLSGVQAYARALRSLSQVTALRVRSLMFAYEPEAFTSEVIEELIALNHLDPAGPTRLELETQFVHSSEFRLVHGELIRRLLAKGVTVYNNIALLSGINDSPEEMKRICSNCRQIGIELQNLYVAGLPVQEEWNRNNPVEATTVIDLATHLRRHESGREVPLYVVRTTFGDADFNLNARIVAVHDDHVLMRLLCVTKKAMRDIFSDFDWPEGVEEQNGHPVVPVRGLTAHTNRDFFGDGSKQVDS
ncbi:MAG: hypothetical protein EA399_08590 [Desulfovibrionales bacterium]|nr:MAG: hypothetical protein EA399_08590 [Desulfovibrionales bacterium]